MKSRMKLKILVLTIVILLFVLFVYLSSRGAVNDNDEDEILCAADVRQCLDGEYVARVPPTCEFRACSDFTDCVSNVTLLYTDLTGDSNKIQIDMFGETFEQLNYVLCNEEPLECKSAGITRTPVWVFTNLDNETFQGWLYLDFISELSECEIVYLEE